MTDTAAIEDRHLRAMQLPRPSRRRLCWATAVTFACVCGLHLRAEQRRRFNGDESQGFPEPPPAHTQTRHSRHVVTARQVRWVSDGPAWSRRSEQPPATEGQLAARRGVANLPPPASPAEAAVATAPIATAPGGHRARARNGGAMDAKTLYGAGPTFSANPAPAALCAAIADGHRRAGRHAPHQLDAVYTWTNGSNPAFIRECVVYSCLAFLGLVTRASLPL